MDISIDTRKFSLAVYFCSRYTSLTYMNLLSKREIASVQLIEVEISEDEMGVYQRCLYYIF